MYSNVSESFEKLPEFKSFVSILIMQIFIWRRKYTSILYIHYFVIIFPKWDFWAQWQELHIVISSNLSQWRFEAKNDESSTLKKQRFSDFCLQLFIFIECNIKSRNVESCCEEVGIKYNIKDNSKTMTNITRKA